MKGHIYRPNCKCPDKKNEKYICKCGALWGYLLDIGVNPATGKRQQKFKGGFRTKKEASAAVAAYQTELANGTHVEETNLMFKDFAKKWLKIYSESKNVKVSTLRIRQHEIDKLLHYFEYEKLKDITKISYQDAISDLKKRGYADNTMDGVHRTGRMIYKKAIELDLVKVDPTLYAYVPKTKKSIEELEHEDEVVKYLEKDELILFLRTAREMGLEKDYIIFMTLAYSGLRVGELCALKWSDCDLVENTISVTKTCYNPNNNAAAYELLPPKTKSSKRTIDLDNSVIEELKKHRAAQNELNMRNRDKYHDKDFVFAKIGEYLGYPEFTEAIGRRMHRLLKLAGLNESLTPHSLRHTHCSLLAEAGVGLHEIMTRLGHQDDKTTKSVYLHVTKTMKKEASQKFGELMRNLNVK